MYLDDCKDPAPIYFGVMIYFYVSLSMGFLIVCCLCCCICCIAVGAAGFAGAAAMDR